MFDHLHYPALRTKTPAAVRETVWWWYKNNREQKYNKQHSERVVYYKGYIRQIPWGRWVFQQTRISNPQPGKILPASQPASQPAKPASPSAEPIPAARICYYSFKASSPWQFTTDMAASCSNIKNEGRNEKITSSTGNREFSMCGLWNIWQSRYFNSTLLLKIQVSCVVTPFRFVNTYRHFEGSQSVYLYWQSVLKSDCLIQ